MIHANSRSMLLVIKVHIEVLISKLSNSILENLLFVRKKQLVQNLISL